ncbi:MAG: hypothetical protein U0746_05000 [Gemmataceae bacterium]
MTKRVLQARAAGLLVAGWVAGCQNPSQRSAYSDNPLLVNRQPLVQASASSGYKPTAPAAQYAAVTPPPPPAPVAPRVALTKITGEIPPRVGGEASEGPPLPMSPTAPSAAVQSPTALSPAAPPPAFAAAPPAQIAPLPARSLDRPEPPPPAMPQPTVVESPAALPAPSPGPTLEAPKPAEIVPVSGGSTFKDGGRYGYASDYTRLRGELDRHYRGHMDLRFRAASEEDSFGGKVRLENDPRLSEYRAGDVVEVYGELIREPGGESGTQYPRYHIKEIKLVERR